MKGTTNTKYQFQSDAFEKFPKPQYLFLGTYQNVFVLLWHSDILSILGNKLNLKKKSDLLHTVGPR